MPLNSQSYSCQAYNQHLEGVEAPPYRLGFSHEKAPPHLSTGISIRLPLSIEMVTQIPIFCAFPFFFCIHLFKYEQREPCQSISTSRDKGFIYSKCKKPSRFPRL